MSVDEHREESAVGAARARMLRDGTVQLYRTSDFAAAHGVSLRTVWNLIAAGEVDAIKVGKLVLITAESARAWIERAPRVKAKGKS